MGEVDITEHVLVPKHIVLNEGEEVTFLNSYNIGKDNLPLIKTSDPIIKTLEEQMGESLKGKILKIIRHNSPAGEGVYYRYVID